MPEIMRKLYNFEVKELSDRVLRFTGSTETQDRDGEVIKVTGWDLENYKKNPVFMWAHDYSQPPIGKAVNVHKRQGNLIFDIEFADKDTYGFADTIYKLYKGGFLHATSVGFMPDPDYIIEGDGIKTPRRTYTKQELLELSGVPVPSNPDALRNAADKIGVSVKSLKNIFEDIQEAEIVDLTEEVTKPEVTDEYIRIPVDTGDHEGHRIRTITISDKEGIKSLYCGTCKKIMTYLFAKEKGWDTTKAKKWVKEHEGKSLAELQEHKVSQAEIGDELDYISTLINTGSFSDDNNKKIESILFVILKYLKYEATKHYNSNGTENGFDVRGTKRITGSDIPDDINIKSIINQAVINAIK